MNRKIVFGSSIVFLVCGLFGLRMAAQSGNSRPQHDADGGDPTTCISNAILQITANPAAVTYGQSTTVHWSAKFPAGCSSVHARLNGTPVVNTGDLTTVPPNTTTYVLLVNAILQGTYEEKSVMAQVQVSFPNHVVIDPSVQNPASVIVGALTSSNPEETVELCNVDIDMTGISGVVIGDNRTFIASPACARSPRNLGPRIFVTDARGSEPLFEIRGDNVQISGFRLEGPTSGTGQGSRKEVGIQIVPFDLPTPIKSLEISNMEIFHWSGAGVQVTDNAASLPRGRLTNADVGAVHIFNSYFHHNRHDDSYGYGVAVTDGAYALIEHNVFDENRHGIAGGSWNRKGDYSGYTARENLILTGGGVDCTESDWVVFCLWLCECWHTHQIDMHGSGNNWYSSTNWECGTAGETIIIQRNTVLYTSGLAIKIRGNPLDKAVVDGNVFALGSQTDAIGQNGACGWGDNITNPIQVLPNNAYGANPMSQLGSCDFFGDGQQDKFMATGVTWWAQSPTTLEWRYMNTMQEKLPELQLKRIDNDAICDVAPRTNNPAQLPLKYSKSGTGPWVSLEVLN